jgi:hypothetical protein
MCTCADVQMFRCSEVHRRHIDDAAMHVLEVDMQEVQNM